MIDIFDNVLQIAVLLFCAGVTLYRAAALQSRTWTLSFFFFGSWVMGDIYWLLCILFYGDTPRISIVSDLSWYSSFIFLYLIIRQSGPPEDMDRAGLLPWLAAVFAAGMSVFYMQWGEILNNIVYAVFMGLLLFASIRRLQDKKTAPGCRFLSAMTLIYCLLVYCLWTASCFWSDDVPLHPYYVFDMLITVSLLFLLSAMKKAAAE